VITRDSLLCCLDFDATVVEGGVTYLRDFGPYDIRFPLTGAGAPAPPTRNANGGYDFNGTTQYLESTAGSTARFWSAWPPGHAEFTIIAKLAWTSQVQFDAIFWCANNVPSSGIVLRHNTVERTEMRSHIAGGGYVQDTADVPLTGRTRTVVRSIRFTAGAPVGIWQTYDQGTRVAQATGGTGIPVWEVNPLIFGRNGTGGLRWGGSMFYFAVLKTIPTVDEHDEIQSLLRDGRKPWCG